jgi:hypothetical protein
MPNFVFIYRGGKPGQTKEEQDKIMAAWGGWFDKLGDKLVDGGNPFGPPKTVKTGGVSDGTDGEPASGYSVVSADSQDAAAELAKGCPMLEDSDNGKVEVYEAFPM